MQTTLSQAFGGSMFGALGVGRPRSRKRMIEQIAKEALSGVDKAKGLWGKRDWEGAMSELHKMSRLVEEGVDLAETVIGISLPRVRKQATMVGEAISKAAETMYEEDPNASQTIVRNSSNALSKAAQALLNTSNALRDDMEKCEDFSEDNLIKSMNDA